MSEVINNVLPLILIFTLGYLFKRLGVLNNENGDLLLKLFFYVSLPALIILSITKIDLTPELLSLPLISGSIVFISSVIALMLVRKFKLPRRSTGVFVIGSAIMNGGFIFPFTYAFYGIDGMAIATLFDFGHAIMVLSYVYYLACRYGNDSHTAIKMVGKFFRSPPLLALFVAIFMNLADLQLPVFGVNFLKTLSDMTTPVVMLAIGIYFNHRIVFPLPTLVVLLIRMCGGLMLGILFVTLLDLHGTTKIIVLIFSTAPTGVNTLTFSSLEGLDREFAASVVSYSTLIGLLVTPLLIYLTRVGIISL